MNQLEYQIMSEREQTYWWHIGRLNILDEQIKSIATKSNKESFKILNIGCGTGGTINMLKKHSRNVINIDVSKTAIEFTRKAGHEATLVDIKKLPYESNEFDLIVAFDVLEHIEDETESLKEWRRVLKSDGTCLISVPAYQWLWSNHDLSLDHFRRYTTGSLREVVKLAGFRPIRLGYMIAFSLPMVVGFRLLNNVIYARKASAKSSYVDVPGSVNNIFISMLNVEAIIQRRVAMPFGTSVLARLKK